jgi:PAS domain S-box-containing protein
MTHPSPRILLVDEPGDDLALASLVLKEALVGARVEGIDCLAALSGALAVGPPSVVITECALSWSDGFAVLDAVRHQHADCPVVFFSASHEPGPQDTLRGLDGWVPKTSTGYLHLPALVRRLARRAATPSPDPPLRPGTGVDQLPVAVITASPSGEILGANEAAASLLGLSDRARLRGRALQFILRPGEARDALVAALEAGGAIRGAEVQLARQDGGTTWARLSLWSGSGPDGAARCAATLEDITPYKQAEDRLTRLTQELGRSNEALERFASVVSHDLRGPLGVVRRGARLLVDSYGEGLEPDASKLVDTIIQGSERLEGMVEDILDLSRLGARAGTVEPTDFEAVADQALATLEPAIRDSGASVSRDGLPTLPADRGQICRLFENLVGNALKFHNGKPPLVHISAHEEPGCWVFSVRDNGIGMEPQDTERIFRMFQRLQNGSHPGNGMGLAICKDIVERHGGRIWVQSMRGEGSTFYFTIPTGDARAGDLDETHC